MLRFRRVPLAKKFKDKRGEGGKGGIKIFRRNCFVSHCRIFPLAKYLVFR